jgi:hypothetical protein
LGEYIEEAEGGWQTQAFRVGSPDMTIWARSTAIAAAEGRKSTIKSFPLGIPKAYTEWFAIERISMPWLGPRQGKGQIFLPRVSLLTAFKRYDGLHLVVVAVSADNVTTELQTYGAGGIAVLSRNENPTQALATVVTGVGADPIETITGIFAFIRQYYFSKQVEKNHFSFVPIHSKPELISWSDGLAYCTWNSLGRELTEQRVLDSLDDFAKAGIKITALIMDDNWQSLDEYGSIRHLTGWSEFEADRKAFPNGLKGLTSAIKRRWPHIRHIAVWHGLMGYWGGVSPKGKIAQKYKTRDVPKRDRDEVMTVVDAEDVGKMYMDFYE